MKIKSWMMVEARVRCSREGSWCSAELSEGWAGLSPKFRGSTTPSGREQRMLIRSSVVRSVGRARRRYAKEWM